MTEAGVTGSTPSQPSLSGRVLDGRYRIEELVGAGGMGVVYSGWHIKLEKRVAVKVLNPRFAGQPDAVKRFLREARSASKISHRNVVEVMDFGQSDDLVYFVMEFLEGADLSSVIRREAPLPWQKSRWVLLQIVRALKAAHTQGIVHRDIKPANCFVVRTPDDEPDVVKVLDFGIAKVVDRDAATDGLTSTSQVIGTALYMAPEQAMGKPIDARTDVYALGVVAFELVAGVKPFTGATPFEVLMKRVNEAPPSVLVHAPQLHPDIDRMLRQAMAREPDQRFQSMRAFEEALLAISDDAGAVPASMAVTPSGPLMQDGLLTATSSRDRPRVPPGEGTQTGLGLGVGSGLGTDGGSGVAEVTATGARAALAVTPRADSSPSFRTAVPGSSGPVASDGMPLTGPIGATEVGPPLAPAASDAPTLDGPALQTSEMVRPATLRSGSERRSRGGWWVAAGAVVVSSVGAAWLFARGPLSSGASQPDAVAVGTPRSEPLSDEPPREADDTRDREAADPGLGADSIPTSPSNIRPEPIADEPGLAADSPAESAEQTPDDSEVESPGERPSTAPGPRPRPTGKGRTGSRPKTPPSRPKVLSALRKKARKRCKDGTPGDVAGFSFFVDSSGKAGMIRDQGSTAAAPKLSCVKALIKAAKFGTGADETQRLEVRF